MTSVLILGSLTIDIINGEKKRGGPAYYCSLASKFYGATYKCVGLKPRGYSWSVPEGWFLECVGPVFKHIYFKGRRKSVLISKPIVLDKCPLNPKKFDIIIINPVFWEFSPSLVREIVKNSFVVIDVQGFVRSVNKASEITYTPLGEMMMRIFEQSKIIHISDEELSAIKKLPTNPINIITHGPEGSKIVHKQKIIKIPAYKTEGDPTGAGDIFTTLLALEYFKTKNIVSATIFASSVVSLFIEGKIGYDIDKIVKIPELIREIKERSEKIKRSIECYEHGI